MATLEGRRILVVEDDYFIASEVATTLARRGAEVVGPVSSVEDALALIGDAAPDAALPDGAVLDINLRGEMAFPVADALLARRIPFVFATGYDRNVIPERYAAIPRCPKPVSYLELTRAFG